MDVVARPCIVCETVFLPHPKGWNALYCSERCKITRRPPRKSRAGQETYYSRVVKDDPVRVKKHRAASNKSRQVTRSWLYDYKLARGCVDCGYNDHPAALQLDHMGEKTAEISLIRSSVRRLQEEIERGQCVVRCANCHSVKTWAEKKGLPSPDGHAKWIA